MKYQGFTLIELMMALAILAILTSIAIPSFQTMISGNRIEAQSNLLLTAIASARSEAIKNNNTVTMCKSNNGSNCVSGASWSDGWIVFADTNSNSTRDSGERIVKRFDAAPGGFTFIASTNLQNSFSFRPSGELLNLGGNIVVCGPDQDIALGHQISLSAVGRPRRDEGVTSCS